MPQRKDMTNYALAALVIVIATLLEMHLLDLSAQAGAGLMLALTLS